MTAARLAPQLVPAFTFGEFLGKPVRWNRDVLKPLWVLRDLCQAISVNFYGRNTLPSQHQDYTSYQTVWTNGGPQKLLCVNEPGLHALVLKSTDPVAVDFQKWVLEEVLPALRKSSEVPIYSFQADNGQIIEITARVNKLSQELGFVQEELDFATQKIQRLEELYKLPSLPTSTRQEATNFLASLPAAKDVPIVSDRQKLVNIVKASVIASGKGNNEYQRRFNTLYREFKDRYKIDLKARALNSGRSILDVAEKPGKQNGKELENQIPNLINLATMLFNHASS